MRKKNRVRLCALIMMGATLMTSPVTFAAPPDTAGTQTYFREWVYKVLEDGHLYKRLFNASTGHWESEWIFVI